MTDGHRGPPPRMTIVSEHQLRNDPGEARQVGAWVEAFVRRAGLSAEVQNALDLSLVEWITYHRRVTV